MDPYKLLKADHEKVSELFERIESASGREKLNTFKKLKKELDVHAHVEEIIFYPALKNQKESRDITLEAYEEHRVVKDLLADLAAANKPSDEWNAKLTVLKENVDHHVEEEEGELFDKAKDVLTTEQAEVLGDKMAAEKARQGAPVSEEVKEPGLIEKVVDLFRGSKKKTAKKRPTKKSASSKASTKRRSTKKAAGKKGAKGKKAAKGVAKKASKKSASAGRKAARKKSA